MNAAAIRELSLIEVRDALARGEVTAEVVVTAAIEQAERFIPDHNLFMTFLPGAALEQARAADQAFAAGKLLGPLHGVPFHVKDNIDYAGVRTSAGSKVLEARVPELDATAVAKVRAAGGISLGQTMCVDLVGGWGPVSPWYGGVPNPWNPKLIPGHSSSGAGAAIALRIGYAGLGTDAGGSVRNPASLCGVVGLKATHGLVSIAGLVPTGPVSVDHIGPITRTVADAELMLEVMMGYDPRDPDSVDRLPARFEGLHDLRGIKLGIPEAYFWEDLDPEIEVACREPVELLVAAGAELVPVAIESIGLLKHIQVVLDAESFVYHQRFLEETAELYAPHKRAKLLASQQYLAHDYVRAQRARSLFAAEMQTVSSLVDVLAMPTSYVPAHGLNDAAGDLNISRQRMPFNQCGLPAISIPCAVHSNGAPFGLQLTAGRFQDFKLLKVAKMAEALIAFDEAPSVLGRLKAVA